MRKYIVLIPIIVGSLSVFGQESEDHGVNRPQQTKSHAPDGKEHSLESHLAAIQSYLSFHGAPDDATIQSAVNAFRRLGTAIENYDPEAERDKRDAPLTPQVLKKSVSAFLAVLAQTPPDHASPAFELYETLALIALKVMPVIAKQGNGPAAQRSILEGFWKLPLTDPKLQQIFITTLINVRQSYLDPQAEPLELPFRNGLNGPNALLAIRGLELLGAHARDALPDLTAKLAVQYGPEYWKVIGRTADALGSIAAGVKSEGNPHLAASVEAASAGLLRALGASKARDHLDSTEHRTYLAARASLVEALGKTGILTQGKEQALLALLTPSEDPAVQQQGYTALAEQLKASAGPISEGVLQTIEKNLLDEEAAEGLSDLLSAITPEKKIDPNGARKLVSEMLKILNKSPESTGAVLSLKYLGKIASHLEGTDSTFTEAVNRLTKLSQDKNLSVRKQAMLSLAEGVRSAPDEMKTRAKGAIEKNLTAPDKDLCFKAAVALGMLGAVSESAFAVMHEALKEEGPKVEKTYGFLKRVPPDHWSEEQAKRIVAAVLPGVLAIEANPKEGKDAAKSEKGLELVSGLLVDSLGKTAGAAHKAMVQLRPSTRITLYDALTKKRLPSGDFFDYHHFVTVHPGKFQMGSPQTEEGHSSDEVPHEVTLTQKFQISDTEVTQALWEDVMGRLPEELYEPRTQNSKGRTSHWYLFRGMTLPGKKSTPRLEKPGFWSN